MLWLGVQVARGNSVWEFETHKCDVLYLCLEDTHIRIQNRLYQLTDEAPAELRIATTSYQIGNGLEQQIEQYLPNFPNTKLVIIDTLSEYFRRLGLGKNVKSATDVKIYKTFRLVRQFKKDLVPLEKSKILYRLSVIEDLLK